MGVIVTVKTSRDIKLGYGLDSKDLCSNGDSPIAQL